MFEVAAYFNSDVNGKLATLDLHIFALPAIVVFKIKSPFTETVIWHRLWRSMLTCGPTTLTEFLVSLNKLQCFKDKYVSPDLTIPVFRVSFVICINNHFGLLFPCGGISARTVLLTSLFLQLLWFVELNRRNRTSQIQLLLDFSFSEWTCPQDLWVLVSPCGKGSVSREKWPAAVKLYQWVTKRVS